MSQTRAELDRKISLLESRAREMSPRELTRRYMPEYFVDRVIGGLLTLVGLRLAWGTYRKRAQHREHVRRAAALYTRF
jgi:hypothetical protein